MNNYERFAQTIHFGAPDRLMTYDVVQHPGLYERFGGQGPALEINARVCRAIGVDAIRSLYSAGSHWLKETLDEWAEHIGINQREWRLDSGGNTYWIAERPFSTPDGLRRKLPAVPQKSRVAHTYVPFLREARRVLYPDVVFIGSAEGPFTSCYNYCGQELFFELLLDDPATAARLLDVFTEYGRLLAEIYAEHPVAPAFLLGEDIAYKTSTLASPEWLRRELFPRLKRIYAPLKAKGLTCFYHSDGDLSAVLDDLVHDVGIEGLNPIEPAANHMDIVAIRKRYPRLILLGNIDTSGVLPFGTPDQVDAAVKSLIDAIGRAGGLLIGSSSEVHPHVPVENALAMYRAVHKYGKLT